MKSFAACVAAVATVAIVSSCTSPAGNSGDGHEDGEHGIESSAAGGQPSASNADDVAFATGMIPHHQQAVEMSAMVPERSTNPAVIKLAADISAAQGPEIETMKKFLVQWNASTDSSGHEGHQGMEMQGMIDDATMSELKTLRGIDFDVLWLNSMISHHRGAIEMANAEIANGANADAKKLAEQIITVQKAEIAQMQQLGG